ncbi:MAG: hypothetical protein ACYCV7_06165 [Acidimicrobiales bacterium]
MPRPIVIDRALAVARVDLAPSARPPSAPATLTATVVAVVGSLATNAALVAVGTAAFHSTVGFKYFRFFDYGSLTVMGALTGCAAWPVVTRLSSTPRWLFYRLAIAVSLLLFLPDGWLLVRHDSAPAVAVLMVMHLAIAVITYNALVRLAPVRTIEGAPAADALALDRQAADALALDRQAGPTSPAEKDPPRTFVWVAMMIGVGVELALGVVTLVLVPSGRPSGWIPTEGSAVYLAHAIFGGILALGALTLVRTVRRLDRMSRIAVVAGLFGIALAAGGGILAIDLPTRLLGMGLMLVGSLTAGFAYLMPIIEALPDPTPA